MSDKPQPPKRLSMDQMLTDPALKPVPKPRSPRPYYRDRDHDLDGFHGTGLTEEDILGYTPGDRD